MLDSQFAPGNYQTISSYPFDAARTSPMFPPVCLKSHWDPTAMLKRVIPEDSQVGQATLPLSFRPNTRICMEYVNAGDSVVLPKAPVVGPQVYPVNQYMNAIDRESALRRLDRPLGPETRPNYVPPTDSDMYTYKKISLPRRLPDIRNVSEMEVPSVLLRDGAPAYNCREVADRAAIRDQMAAGKMFGYATKLAKYGVNQSAAPQAAKNMQ